MKKKSVFFMLVALAGVVLLSCNSGELLAFNSNYEVETYPLPMNSWEYSENLTDTIKFLIVGLTEYNQYDDVLSIFNHFKDEDSGSDVWNVVCWNGALDGLSEMVMEVCDKAVFLDPEIGAFRDSRGLARAITGDINGAIEDFGFFIIWYENLSDREIAVHGLSEEMVTRRRAWIQDLKDGMSPFDDRELATLQVEENSSIFDDDNLVFQAFESLHEYHYYQYAGDIFISLMDSDGVEPDAESAWFFYYFCVNGSLYGQAESILHLCNIAADSMPVDGIYLDGRGIARTMTGDVEGAIDDFNKFIAATESNPPDELSTLYLDAVIPPENVLRWIELLQNNEYPFTQNDFLMLYGLLELP